MKAKVITPENYKQFKPSEFVRSFVSDIEVAESKKKPMDMYSFSQDEAGSNCLPCLGGMACMNLGLPIKPFDTLLIYDERDLKAQVAWLGDAIRQGLTQSFYDHLKLMYPKRSFEYSEPSITVKQFNSIQRIPALSDLKKQIHAYADALELQGN